MEILLAFMFGLGLGSVLARARQAEDKEADAPATPGATPEPESLGRSLLRLGDELDENEAGKLADPHDILGHPKFEKGVGMLTDPEVPLEQVVGYALGTHWVVGIMGSEALARRPDSQPAVERVLANIGQWAQWPLFFRLRFLAARADRPVIGPVLAEVNDWWGKEPVTVAAVDEFIAERVEAGEVLSFGDALEDATPERVGEIEKFVQRLEARHGGPLLAEISNHRAGMLDPDFVRSAGRLWTGEVPGAPVFGSGRVAAHLEEMRRAFGEDPPRSVLLVGEAGVGKTALRRAFSKDLAAQGWRIFQTSGSEILAGTRYVGDIETRVDQLRRNACVAKRVALFVDALNELSTAGRTSQHQVGVLDMIWPYVKSQELYLVAEVAPAAYQALERAYPGLPVVMKVIRVPPMDEGETAALAEAVLSGACPGMPEATSGPVVQETLQLAHTYLAHRALPGNALGLLEIALARAEAGGQPASIERSHLLAGLSELTGLPREVLDETQRLDVEGLRREFHRRVIGQDEAVDCLVERIAMLKAGLTDPKRPIGVFLFAGPTGTGKTEIAKTLAELLFGSPEQMIRLDMSEFQTEESLARLIGPFRGEHEQGSVSLVQRIREKPFSVVLLDEFEKAHRNVWDLFLQVFDDGRLTDRQGNLADFRHAIIILTSNLGATIRTDAGVGFVGTAGQFYAREVTKAVERTFRREFINRLDRVIVFRPLSRDVMRRILRKELDNALSRRGFQSKAWAVEWEDSAIEFLLSKGFTPDLGARPLRRAIESHLLAPLSVTIVENRAPEGEQFLFVRSDGDALQVEFVDPDAEPETPPPTSPTTAAAGPLSVTGLMLETTGAAIEEAFLNARVRAIVSRVEDEAWQDAKAEALAQINRGGFWDREDRFDVLDRVELMDRIESATASLESLAERLHRSGRSASLGRRVAEKLYVLEAGLEDLDLTRPGMAFLGVRLVREDADHAEAGDFLARIQDMYAAWAARRRMHWAELTPRRVDPASGGVYSVAGFGSWAILSREAGLHVLESPRDDSRFDRVRVRVSVAPQSVAPNAPKGELLEAARRALDAPEHRANAVIRRYRESPSPLVRDNVSGWRTGRIDAIWAGDFDVWR
ncbi:MAG TPA: AAA family ATPase [Longimicrobiales bacterium]|nr:AAA family ATPase [Longimicrobiales bacterium]